MVAEGSSAWEVTGYALAASQVILPCVSVTLLCQKFFQYWWQLVVAKHATAATTILHPAMNAYTARRRLSMMLSWDKTRVKAAIQAVEAAAPASVSSNGAAASKSTKAPTYRRGSV